MAAEPTFRSVGIEWFGRILSDSNSLNIYSVKLQKTIYNKWPPCSFSFSSSDF